MRFVSIIYSLGCESPVNNGNLSSRYAVANFSHSSLTHSLTHSLAHSLPPSLTKTHSLTHEDSLTLSLSLAHSLTKTHSRRLTHEDSLTKNHSRRRTHARTHEDSRRFTHAGASRRISTSQHNITRGDASMHTCGCLSVCKKTRHLKRESESHAWVTSDRRAPEKLIRSCGPWLLLEGTKSALARSFPERLGVWFRKVVNLLCRVRENTFVSHPIAIDRALLTPTPHSHNHGGEFLDSVPCPRQARLDQTAQPGAPCYQSYPLPERQNYNCVRKCASHQRAVVPSGRKCF